MQHDHCGEPLTASYSGTLFIVCSNTEIKRLLRAHPNIMNHWTKRSKKLNDIQKEALCWALKNRFQLIQGPPGQTLINLHSAFKLRFVCRMNTDTNYNVYGEL